VSIRTVIRPHIRRPSAGVVIEPLELRQLLSATVAGVARPIHVAAQTVALVQRAAPARATVAHVTTVRPFDDGGDDGDSGGDDGGDDGGDSGGSTDDGGTDAGGDTSDTGSTDSGTADSGTADSGTSDSGTPDDGNGFADGSSGGSVSDGSTDTRGTTTDGGTTTTTTTGTTDDGTTTTTIDTAGGSTDDGGDYALLYPSGDYCDDALYDAPVGQYGNGGLPTRSGTPNFGGTLHVRLPADPVAGSAGTAPVDVFNTGSRADGQFDIALGISADGSAVDAVRVADDTVGVHLGHDRVTVYRIPFHLPVTLTPGTYQFMALIDAGNDFVETNEADNVAVGPTVAVGQGVPDVSVSAVAAHAAVRAGQADDVVVHLQDVGNAIESGSVVVTVSLEPTDGSSAATVLTTATRSVHVGLKGRAKLAVPVAVPTGLAAGSYRLAVQVTPVAGDVDAADKSAVATVTVRTPAARHV
jgi:hypothetical protein